MKFIYIDSTYGSDENDGLARDSAVETITKAISMNESGDVCVMLPSINAYIIDNFNIVCESTTDVILIGAGQAYESVIQIYNSSSILSPKNNFVLANCKIEPGKSLNSFFTFDIETYYLKRIYNVIFTKKSFDGTLYPNSSYFSFYNAYSKANFIFKNCTFCGPVERHPIYCGHEYIDKCIYVEGTNSSYKGISKYNLLDNPNNVAVHINNFKSDYSVDGYPTVGHTSYDELLKDIPAVIPLFLDTLLKINNQYYSIHQSNYDISAKSYIPLSHADFNNHGFYINDLLKEITISGETFRPIDKFDTFSIVSNAHKTIELLGLKNYSEMAVATENIDLSISSNINSMILTADSNLRGTMKLAFSLNDSTAQKWYTVTNGILTELTITIPLKDHSLFSEDEKQQWNNAKNTILANGISIEDFNSINLNMLADSMDSIRFVYVLYRPGYADNITVQNLEWNFDAKGHLDKMKDSEYNVSIYDHSAKITSLIKNALLKVNIMI